MAYTYEQAFKALFPGASWEPSGGANYLTNCPFHEHEKAKTFAIDFDEGLWHCFNPDCAVSGRGVRQLKQRMYRDGRIKEFEEALIQGKNFDEDVLRFLTEERGLTIETLKKYHIAQSVKQEKHWLTGVLEPKKYVLIPIFDEQGNLIAGRNYLLPAYRGEKDPKIKFAWPKSTVTLYPVSSLRHETLVITEGEWDALLLNQHGIPAITSTGGSNYSFKTFAPLLKGKTLYICYDCDDAGRKGAEKIAEELVTADGTDVFIMDLQLDDGEDVTDFFVTHGYTVDDFRKLMDDAEQVEHYLPPELRMSDIGSDHVNQQYLVTARVLGEAGINKFIWAHHTELTCRGADLKICNMCPLQTRPTTVTLDPSDPRVVNLMEQPPDRQKAFIGALAGIPLITQSKRCMNWSAGDGSKAELAVPIFIESVEEDTPDSKKEMAGYVTTEKAANALRSGKEAQFKLTPVQDTQKDGKLIFIAEEVIPLQDDLDTFRMTDDLHQQLQIFQGDPFEKIPEISSSLNRNVFRIRGREDAITAYDLVYHTVIGIPNPNAPGRIIKGWAELLVIGDPGEGKSQLAMEMQGYYGLGAIQDAATATPGGLTVTTVQLGGKWIFRDGLLPLNDRRMVFIDEFNKLHAEDMGRLNTSRSSGTITASSSAGTYEKDARVRLVWITNPKDGQRIEIGRDAGEYPIKMVEDLFPDRGAQDRLDMAILILRDDPKPDFDNPPEEYEDPVYTRQLCRSLVLWAWSRRPEHIHFTEEAILETRLASDRLRRTFWHADSNIELINSGERTTERVIRLSAAVAARTYSTADGENLFITKEHVQFVEQFLREQYQKFEFDKYIRSLHTRQRVKPQETDTETEATSTIKQTSQSLVIGTLQDDRLFYDMLDSGKYNLSLERKLDNRNVLSWLYSNDYVRTDDGVHFKFTKVFYEELEPKLGEVAHDF